MTNKENLSTRRVLSIDAFRGITIFAMIFVNELAGIKNVPQWLKHMPGIHILPEYFEIGIPDILWSLLFSVIMMYAMRVLNKYKIQLHL